MINDSMRETSREEQLTVDKALTADELRRLLLTRGWVFESSNGYPDGRFLYRFTIIIGRVERRATQ